MIKPIDWGVAPILHETLLAYEMGGEYLGWPVAKVKSSRFPTSFSYFRVAPLGFLTRTTKPRGIQ